MITKIDDDFVSMSNFGYFSVFNSVRNYYVSSVLWNVKKYVLEPVGIAVIINTKNVIINHLKNSYH